MHVWVKKSVLVHSLFIFIIFIHIVQKDTKKKDKKYIMLRNETVT